MAESAYFLIASFADGAIRSSRARPSRRDRRTRGSLARHSRARFLAVFGGSSLDAPMGGAHARGSAAPAGAPKHRGTGATKPSPSPPWWAPARLRPLSVALSALLTVVLAYLLYDNTPRSLFAVGGVGEGGYAGLSGDTLARTTLFMSSADRGACLGWSLSKGSWLHGKRACAWPNSKAAGCIHIAIRHSWAFGREASRRCGARRVDRDEIGDMFKDGKRVAVVGDSVAREMYAAILRAVAKDPLAPRKLKESGEKHSNHAHDLFGGGRAQFVWAPFLENVTATLRDPAFSGAKDPRDAADRGDPPDVLLLGSSALWHMLHVGDVDAYDAALGELLEVVKTESPWWRAMRRNKDAIGVGNCGGACGMPRTVALWATTSRVAPEKFGDPRKIATMTPKNVQLYNERARRHPEILVSEKTRGAGARRGWNGMGAAFAPVDLDEMTRACGKGCTEDGIHYDSVLYDAAAQVAFNQIRLAWRL